MKPLMENQKIHFDDHIEEMLIANVPVRDKWWKFWLPKSVRYFYGIYSKMGDISQISIADKRISIIGREYRG